MKTQKYKRGQIWWYNNNNVWDGGTYNQGKSRPVIIVSNELANANSNTLIAVPCTSQEKREMPTHITFEMNDVKNTAMAECLMSVATDKLGAYITTLDEELTAKLEGCILVALGMKETIKENAIKRIVIHNTGDTPITRINNEHIEPVVKPNDLTLKMVHDAQHIKQENINANTITTNIKNKRLSLEEKKQFIKEYQTKSKKYMIKKYNLKNEDCLFNKAYIIRKQLKEKSGE